MIWCNLRDFGDVARFIFFKITEEIIQKLLTPAYSAYFIPAVTFQSSLPLP